MKINGRTALVTGASSGIGRAVAMELARAGCHLRLVGRDATRLAEVAARTGGEAIVADLGTPDGLDDAASAARDVDVLVNNAGLGWAGPLAEMPTERLAQLVEVNLAAPLRLTREAWPGMARRGGGSLVFVSSIAVVGVRQEAAYAATKAGVRAFADSLRYEAPHSRIRVTTVLPAIVRTPFFDRRGRASPRQFPKGVSPRRVARAVLRGIERETPEVFVPRWTVVAARLHGAMPGTFHRLARRYG